MTGLLVDDRIAALEAERDRQHLEIGRLHIEIAGLRSRLQYAREPRSRGEDRAFLRACREEMVLWKISTAFLIALVRAHAARPGPEDAERYLLTLAIRHRVDIGPRPPLTGVRRGLWRAWTTWAWRDPPTTRRERWRRVRETFSTLSDEARLEVDAIEARGPDVLADRVDYLAQAHERAELDAAALRSVR